MMLDHFILYVTLIYICYVCYISHTASQFAIYRTVM